MIRLKGPAFAQVSSTDQTSEHASDWLPPNIVITDCDDEIEKLKIGKLLTEDPLKHFHAQQESQSRALVYFLEVQKWKWRFSSQRAL